MLIYVAFSLIHNMCCADLGFALNIHVTLKQNTNTLSVSL